MNYKIRVKLRIKLTQTYEGKITSVGSIELLLAKNSWLKMEIKPITIIQVCKQAYFFWCQHVRLW